MPIPRPCLGAARRRRNRASDHHYNFARMIATNTGGQHRLIEPKIDVHVGRRSDPDRKRILADARRVIQTDQGRISLRSVLRGNVWQEEKPPNY